MAGAVAAGAPLGEGSPAGGQGARITIAFDNVTNRRERVTDLEGAVPQAYQPIRRDPVGRTVMLEIRKQF